MKKYLLGAMMLVGSLAYGQGNQVVVPINDSGNATANLGIEVVGKVYTKTAQSLVVEIKSAASPDGRGFAFQMPDMFVNTTGEAVVGKFTAKIVKEDKVLPMTAAITTNLIGRDGSPVERVDGSATVGTATGTTINYLLTGTSKAGDLEHNGSLFVTAVTKGKEGQYTDNTVGLRVEVKGQAPAE